MGVIRRHLVQNLHSAINHLPQSRHTLNNTVCKELKQTQSRPEKTTYLGFGQQQRLVGFIPKERRVVQLEEDKARGEGEKDVGHRHKTLKKVYNQHVNHS